MSESSKILRKNKEYYLDELKTNAIRFRHYYSADTCYYKRKSKHLRKIRSNKVGFYPPKRFTEKEIIFLKRNKGKNYAMIASKLKRSLSSIEHKMERLGLQKYNKWKE